MERSKVIVANWKMHKTVEETESFISSLAPLVQDSRNIIYVAPSFTNIFAASKKAKGSNIIIGAQNMHDADQGAFTGEISAEMLKDAGAEFVIIGHSERRKFFKEKDDFLNRKVKKALSENLQAILCIGETFEEREGGMTEEVLKSQLLGGLAGVQTDKIGEIIIAYEPVWAIGTGRTATPDLAQETHQICRKFLGATWGSDVAEKVVIQYGGSAKPDNALSLMEQKDIDGLLIGGASLDPHSFASIVNFDKSSVES